MSSAGKIAARLAELGIALPKPPNVLANYLPWVKCNNGTQVWIAGQLPKVGDKILTGTLGDPEGANAMTHNRPTLTVDEGKEAAKVAAVNFISQLDCACGGDLDRVRQFVKLNIYVNCETDFISQPQVANGASDLMVEVFGDKGRHARAAVGVASLPSGACVEVDGVVEIDLPQDEKK